MDGVDDTGFYPLSVEQKGVRVKNNTEEKSTRRIEREQSKNGLAWFALFLKGMAMGAADIVPGVSGGTIAFITGIYQRLLAAIASVSWSVISVLRTEGLPAAWRTVDGTFLLVLLLGIGTSIVSFASLLSWVLATHPIPLWSFFFGLILASAWLLISELFGEAREGGPTRERGVRPFGLGLYLIIGVIFAFLLTVAVPVTVEPTHLVLFFAGAVAICAMILPGISGSFMLLLMGLYAPVLTAIKTFDLQVIGLFAVGCLVGILSFARILSWLFLRYRHEVIALLVGIMLGSLNKVWPWKETMTTRINSHGEEVPLLQVNVAPFDYVERVGQEPFLMAAGVMVLMGMLLVLGLDKVNRRQ